MLSEVAEVLDVQRRQWQLVGQAAGGNPGVVLRSGTAPPLGRRGDLPQIAAMSSLLCSTGIRLSQRAIRSRRSVPHCRRAAHLVSSAWVTNVMEASRPISSASSPGGSSRLKLRDATSVPKTIRFTC